MALTKKIQPDKIEIVLANDYYMVQVREKISILENGLEISSSFNRYALAPDHDVSSITDDLVKAQFNAVMTETVKANYQKFLEDQKKELESK